MKGTGRAAAFAALAIALAGCGSSNKPPTATPATLATNEDQPVAGVLVASDPDGDALTIQVGTAPTRGLITLSGGLGFTYTPNADANGTDSFLLVVTDTKGNSASATIAVTITPVDDPPKIVTAFALDEDTPATVDLVSDPEGLAVTVAVTAPPTHGTFATTGAPGRFSYAPVANFNGTDTVTLAADDATGQHSTATVTISVRPVNDPPVANADSAILLQGKTFQIDPRVNDTDVDGDPLTAEVVDMPAGWSAQVRTDGKLDVTPPATFIGGPLTMNYRIRDPGGLTSASTVLLSASFSNGVLYQVPNAGGQVDLWYGDGVRSFAVSAPLRAGEIFQDARSAKSAPVVFYRTRLNFAVHLFRVDLRAPSVVQEIESPTANPGVGEFAISDDGSRVMYAFGGRYKFIDFAVSTTPIDRGAAETGLFLNPSGTRAYFDGLMTQQPYTLWGALFAKATRDATLRVQLTTTVFPNDGVGPVLALSRDERRLFYSASPASGSGVLMVMDPSLPGSERPLLNGTATPLSFVQLTDDESRFLGYCLQGGQSGYCLGSTQGGATINLTSGTGSDFIPSAALSSDGLIFTYSRATVSGPGYAARLYRVDTANAGVAVPIADGLPASTVGYTLGVNSLALSPNGRTLLFSTNEMVPYVGGSYVGGNGRLYLMDPVTPASRQTLRQTSDTIAVSAISSDGTMGVIQQGSAGTLGSIHAVNLLNPSQILQLSQNPAEGAQLIPAYAMQGP